MCLRLYCSNTQITMLWIWYIAQSISRRSLHNIVVAILYLRRKLVILDATLCVYLTVLSDWSPVRDLDPAGINTKMDMIQFESKINGSIHVSNGYTSTCNLLKIIWTDKPNKKVVYGVEWTLRKYFFRTFSFDSAVADFYTSGLWTPTATKGLVSLFAP